MQKNEYPAIGILLVTEKDKASVHFATAGNDNIFVSKYQIVFAHKRLIGGIYEGRDETNAFIEYSRHQ